MKKFLKIAAVKELSTIGDMLRWGMSQFNQANLHYGHGTDNAWDEILQLVLSSLYLPPHINPAVLNSKLLTVERTLVVDRIERRIEDRLPGAYLTHEAWFAGMPFYVDERVLIPRSPLAEIIEKQLHPWVNAVKVERILDLCTGSGCIAMACAMAFPEARVDATDISASALEVAQINLDRHQLSEQVHLIQSDLFNHLKGQIYDVVISNPPYVSETEYATLPQEYYHEPALGLKAGKQGLDIVIKILKEARKHLSLDGILIVEVGNTQAALVERCPEMPFLWLEFERGGDGVFLLTAEQLENYVW